MKKIIVFVLLAITLTGCNLSEELQTVTENINENKVWVFTQLNVPAEDDVIESYYYYAEISESIYEKIKTDTLSSGFLFLNNVKYWDKDDIVREYKDKESSGELIFRIEDIRRLELINEEPVSEEPSTKPEIPTDDKTLESSTIKS